MVIGELAGETEKSAYGRQGMEDRTGTAQPSPEKWSVKTEGASG